MLSRRNPLHYSHPSRAGVAESKQPILAQSYAKLGRENPTEEEQERGERERGRERARRTRIVARDVHTVSGMTPSSSFRLHLSRMREASEITSRDASEQILALIRVGYTVLTYPRVFSARSHLPIRTPPPPPAAAILALLSRPAAIPHADIYTTPVCSLYFWLREKFDVSVGPGQLSRGGAIYRPGVSVARKSSAIKDPLSLTRYL